MSTCRSEYWLALGSFDKDCVEDDGPGVVLHEATCPGALPRALRTNQNIESCRVRRTQERGVERFVRVLPRLGIPLRRDHATCFSLQEVIGVDVGPGHVSSASLSPV